MRIHDLIPLYDYGRGLRSLMEGKRKHWAGREKPLKRLSVREVRVTALKRGVNEMGRMGRGTGPCRREGPAAERRRGRRSATSLPTPGLVIQRGAGHIRASHDEVA